MNWDKIKYEQRSSSILIYITNFQTGQSKTYFLIPTPLLGKSSARSLKKKPVTFTIVPSGKHEKHALIILAITWRSAAFPYIRATRKAVKT